MSNQQVGTVFDRVIQDVCDASQVDFEESGVDQKTLLDLRLSWQKKLSSLGVAHFPWDPAPPQQSTPPPSQNQILPPTATVPSNAPRPAPPQTQHAHPQPFQQSVPGTTAPLQAPVAPGPVSGTAGQVPGAPNTMGQPPHIKTEPGVNGQGLPPMNNIMPTNPSNPQSARERAANMLHQRYGAAAANSVSQLQAQSQAGMGVPGQPRSQNMSPNGQPTVKTESGYPMPSSSIGNAQTDGPSDFLSEWKAEVARRRESAESQGGKGDRLLREHLNQRMLQMEGGGLLLPLEEHQSSSKKVSLLGEHGPSDSAPSVPPRPQFDGPGGDDEREEDDEDAINSDLDDPEDDILEGDEGEDAVGQVMLCTYDKVQRVKNKWKCTLKDGVLTTGGKEYVFHKGQGEFEW
ncbi:hypothetical protein PHISCL_01797 [Aspergillus sclerotialis]|uniref:Transcription initiation factor IIA large subunit n=1 Tax=Aspergillus sclerotialis TaxID=2070753 RepID=A0A3A2ZT24_9EURO|nr:hypothetical protein PHISCL_01797 [Aspergillus sclerotialis]